MSDRSQSFVAGIPDIGVQGLWRLRFASYAVIATCFVCPAWSQRPADTVQLFDGSPVRGEVRRTTPEAVEMVTGGSSRSIPTGSIRQILFGGEPTALRSARDAVGEGEWEQALQSLDRIDQDESTEPLIRQDVQFYRAHCQGKLALASGNGEGAAVKSLLSFAEAHRDSWHLHQTAELLGDLALKLGRPNCASRFYGQLSNSSSPETRLRGSFLEAEALRQQGPDQYAAAISKYDAALQIDAKGAAAIRLRQLAAIGKARCNAVVGNPDESIRMLEEIVDEADANNTTLLAQAYVAMGVCYMGQAKPHDAVLAFLHVDLLFNGDADAHAEALYHLSQLWPEIGKPDRAAEARNRLRTRYGNSTWSTRSANRGRTD